MIKDKMIRAMPVEVSVPTESKSPLQPGHDHSLDSIGDHYDNRIR